MKAKDFILFGIINVFLVCVVQCGQFDALMMNSPFRALVGDATERDGDATYHGDYELRGVFLSSNTKLFNIYDASRGKFQWVKLGEPKNNIAIEAFDERSKTLHFYDQEGARHSIVLKNYLKGINKLGISIAQ